MEGEWEQTLERKIGQLSTALHSKSTQLQSLIKNISTIYIEHCPQSYQPTPL